MQIEARSGTPRRQWRFWRALPGQPAPADSRLSAVQRGFFIVVSRPESAAHCINPLIFGFSLQFIPNLLRALSRSDCTGRVALAELRGNSFTPTPVVNTRPTPEQPPRKKQHRHSGIFRVADLGPGTMPRGKYPESPAPAGSHALISRTPTPGGVLHANLGLPRPPPRNFQPPLPQQPPKQTQQRRHNVPPVQSLRDSAAATPVGCAAWRRRFRIFSFRYREMMSGMTMIFLTVMFFPPGILSHAQERSGMP